MKTALITSFTRQECPSLYEALYQSRHIDNERYFLYSSDLIDATNLPRILQNVEPDEIYTLGAHSHVAVSFQTPEYTANATAYANVTWTLHLLEAIRVLKLEKYIVLSGLPISAFRRCGRKSQIENPVPPTKPLCHSQTLCMLDSCQLPRNPRYKRQHWHTAQSLEPVAQRNLFTRQITRAVAPIQAG